MIRFLILTMLFSNPVFSYEVDNFTGRFDKKSDSLAIMNSEMNRRLQNSIQVANDQKIGCDLRKMRLVALEEFRSGSIVSTVTGHTIGALEQFANTNGQIQKNKTTLDKSVYSGIIKNRWLSAVDLGPSVFVNGVYIGTDKFGHFIDQGLDLYEHYKKTKGNTRSALTSSRGSEEGSYGKSTTGVKSYADQVANYEGLLFWTRLTEGAEPYLQCDPKTGTWVQKVQFNFADYVNEAWDEGINCNELSTKEDQKKFEANISKLGPRYACPISNEACVKAYQRYRQYKDFLLSRECQQVGKKGFNPSAVQQTQSGAR